MTADAASPTDGARWPRVICHVDMECFFVAVEVLARPELAGQAVIVGGTAGRGVVASASYEARAYGVRSAMGMSEALRRCPHAICLPGRMSRYVDISLQIMDTFREVSPLVEPLSVDEAFVDCTGAGGIFGSPRHIGRELRQRIRDRLGLSCSVGVAANKSVAKIASELAKPIASRDGVKPGRGVVLVSPGHEREFLAPMSVGVLYGVGPKTRQRLAASGIETVGQLVAMGEHALSQRFGAETGRHLYAMGTGQDDRPVETDRRAKSISNEMTFRHDRYSLEELDDGLVSLVDSVCWRTRGEDLHPRRLTIKLRYADFRTITRSRTAATTLTDERAVLELSRQILSALPLSDGVRLLGVAVADFVDPAAVGEQLDLFDAPHGSTDDPDRPSHHEVLDEVRSRFGASALRPARLADSAERDSKWGPE